jgi:ketosteroid isomerase-like protein
MTNTSQAFDEQAIRALNERYFNALDRVDFDALGDCFTEDTTAVYLGGDWHMQGRSAVLERLGVIRSFDSTIHVLTTMSFAFRDDIVAGEVFAIAYISLSQDGVPRVMVRGLRYRDRYARETDRWRIAHREQDPLWQYEVNATAPMIPAQH